MRFHPADPDIATIYNRIKDSEIDLRPDFQRGEVWSKQKQQKLIDTILRGWVVPPILLLSDVHENRQLVLDGQQRLAAIRDFKDGKFEVDGRIKPISDTIAALHGKKYESLPTEAKRAFDRHTIRLFEVTDFEPEEPAEIFFRLNQPVALTSAEKRNAFIGPVRSQIRSAVEHCKNGAIPHFLGFSNDRMALDDVIARLAFTFESRSLWLKVTANSVNEMFRRKEPIPPELEERLVSAIARMSDALGMVKESATFFGGYPKLSKATFFSWLVFFARASGDAPIALLAKAFAAFEGFRIGGTASWVGEQGDLTMGNEATSISAIVDVYSDRASARAADGSSVVLRDIVLWACLAAFSECRVGLCTDPAFAKIDALRSCVDIRTSSNDERMLEFATEIGWARSI